MTQGIIDSMQNPKADESQNQIMNSVLAIQTAVLSDQSISRGPKSEIDKIIKTFGNIILDKVIGSPSSNHDGFQLLNYCQASLQRIEQLEDSGFTSENPVSIHSSDLSNATENLQSRQTILLILEQIIKDDE